MTQRRKRSRARGGARRRRGGPIGWLWRLVRRVIAAVLGVALGLAWRVGWRAAVAVTLIVGLGVAADYARLPAIGTLIDARSRGSVTILDRGGAVFAWRGQQFGGAITAATVAPVLKKAIVATEDRRFYLHPGLDPIGIAGAIRINLAEGRSPLQGNGGSTITQQTAKLLCVGRPYDAERWESRAAYERDCRRTTLWRKAREAVFALAMELKYDKDEILTLYMNRVYLGAGAVGFEAAAQRYFGVSAANVTLPQATMLAGLLKAPSSLAPTADLEAAQARAKVVIALMEDQGLIPPVDAALARARPAVLSEAARARIGGYFADWLMTRAPDFLTRNTTEDVILRSTFDAQAQRATEAAVSRVYDEKVRDGSKAEVAVVVMSPDGAVRAMVGGRRLRAEGLFNRATQAERQTGSAFKPFVYAAALEAGYSPLSVVVDEPITVNVPGSGPWSPENYTDEYRGAMTLTDALANSINTIAVKVAMNAGLDRVRDIASGFGLATDLADGPALALGASETTLLQMTGAYAGILQGGRAITPYGLNALRLRGEEAPMLGRMGGPGARVIPEATAGQLVYMMREVVRRGSGRRAALDGREAAGKTGTSQKARDAWFIGFTADYVTGVWMGYDDNTPLTGVTGGGLPAEIWRETMTRLHEGRPAQPLPAIAPAPPRAIARSRDAPPGRAIERGILGVLDRILGLN